MGLNFQTAKPAITRPSSNAHRPKINDCRLRARVRIAVVVGAHVACEPPSAIHFNSSQTSLAACHLFSGSLARHFLTTRSSAGGVIGCSEDMGGGAVSKILAITLGEL